MRRGGREGGREGARMKRMFLREQWPWGVRMQGVRGFVRGVGFVGVGIGTFTGVGGVGFDVVCVGKGVVFGVKRPSLKTG